MQLAAPHVSLTVHREVRPEKLLTNKVFVYTTLRKQTADAQPQQHIHHEK